MDACTIFSDPARYYQYRNKWDDVIEASKELSPRVLHQSLTTGELRVNIVNWIHDFSHQHASSASVAFHAVELYDKYVSFLSKDRNFTSRDLLNVASAALCISGKMATPNANGKRFSIHQVIDSRDLYYECLSWDYCIFARQTEDGDQENEDYMTMVREVLQEEKMMMETFEQHDNLLKFPTSCAFLEIYLHKYATSWTGKSEQEVMHRTAFTVLEAMTMDKSVSFAPCTSARVALFLAGALRTMKLLDIKPINPTNLYKVCGYESSSPSAACMPPDIFLLDAPHQDDACAKRAIEKLCDQQVYQWGDFRIRIRPDNLVRGILDQMIDHSESNKSGMVCWKQKS